MQEKHLMVLCYKGACRMKLHFTKEERSWMLYDWANSSYSVIVLAAVFPIFFSDAASASGVDGDYWWSIGTSISTLLIAIFSPILGAFGDYHHQKKRLFTIFLSIGLAATLLCAFVDNWQWMLIGYILSYFGFAGSNLFYDSFITDVTTHKRMNIVSAWAYSLGYIGGSTIPFLISIALLSFGNAIGIDGVLAVKISLILTVLWWALFSIPFLRNVNQKYGKDFPEGNIILITIKNLVKTIKEIRTNRALFLFLIAFFFYIDGVNTVIKMSTAYGATLGLDGIGMILALLVTQLVAFPCSIFFGKLAQYIGTISVILNSIGLYLLICLLGFFMGFGLEERFLTTQEALIIFWILAILVGTVQGGIQSLSRAYLGKLVPFEKSSEYFGFFDIFGKFASIIGPAIYALIKAITGRSSFSILSIILLFLIGGGILLKNRTLYFNTDL